jgi:hypothetical protein
MSEERETCFYCGGYLNPSSGDDPEEVCGCPQASSGYKAGGVNWDQVEKVFGREGMPSCGLTDAARLGGGESRTIYVGRG